jgi:DNA polymerase
MHDSILEIKQKLLSDLNDRMTEECTCALRASATRAVPGDGSANARILLIGEAPGKNEDLQGVPFVGAAGKFLDEMLASIGLSRRDIYITNIVKYRPPENRDPLPQEIDDCSEWLHEQIGIIDPSLIVTLGRHAMNHFFPDKKITDAHGNAYRREFPVGRSQVFYTLYHPAAALYNGSMRDTLKKDFLRIPKVVSTIQNGA